MSTSSGWSRRPELADFLVPEGVHIWLSALPADLLGDPPLGCAGAGVLEKPGTAWDGSQWKGTAKSANGLGRVSIGGNRAGTRLMARGAWGMSGA